jgi:hypothetical protein
MTPSLPVPLQVCPMAPPGAQTYVDQLTGYVLWGVLALFAVGAIIGIGAIVAGRLFQMPHASKAGIVSLVVLAVAAIFYMVGPAILHGILGTGCIS